MFVAVHATTTHCSDACVLTYELANNTVPARPKNSTKKPVRPSAKDHGEDDDSECDEQVQQARRSKET